MSSQLNVASRFARDGSMAHASFVYETCQSSQLIARPMDKVGDKGSHGKQRDSVYVKCNHRRDRKNLQAFLRSITGYGYRKTAVIRETGSREDLLVRVDLRDNVRRE